MSELRKPEQSRYVTHPSAESQTERFAISTDPFSRERMQFVTQIGPELESTFPFYRALLLKGSLAKGRVLTDANARGSDLNIPCYLDADDIVRESEDTLRKLHQQYAPGEAPERGPVIPNDGKWNIFPSQNLSLEVLSKIRLARKAVYRFIRDRGEGLLAASEAPPVGVYPEVGIIDREGPFSIYATVNEYEASTNPMNSEERIAVTRATSMPFVLHIHGDLTPYFQSFFEVLDGLDPAVAEQKWQSVRKAIIQNERWGSTSPAIDPQIPRNVAEAKELYVVRGGPRLTF